MLVTLLQQARGLSAEASLHGAKTLKRGLYNERTAVAVDSDLAEGLLPLAHRDTATARQCQ